MTEDRPHGTARYRTGCRCEVCKKAHADANRRYRTTGSTAVTVELEPTDTSTREAVERELRSIPSADDHPGLWAAALRMAEVMDDPNVRQQHPAAAGRLKDILDGMRPVAVGSDEERKRFLDELAKPV
jgi:hypothetical protein